MKGLVRLQGVIRGHSVKRQTMNAMKYMQLLVRVQTQVQSRRIQMLENRARNEKDDTKLASSLAVSVLMNLWFPTRSLSVGIILAFIVLSRSLMIGTIAC